MAFNMNNLLKDKIVLYVVFFFAVTNLFGYILVGNLEAVRDFTDVRDTVRGYWLALDHGAPGQVYNIGTGVGYTMGWILETLISMSALNIEIIKDYDRIRPSDVPSLICNAGRFMRKCKW